MTEVVLMVWIMGGEPLGRMRYCQQKEEGKVTQRF